MKAIQWMAWRSSTWRTIGIPCIGFIVSLGLVLVLNAFSADRAPVPGSTAILPKTTISATRPAVPPKPKVAAQSAQTQSPPTQSTPQAANGQAAHSKIASNVDHSDQVVSQKAEPVLAQPEVSAAIAADNIWQYAIFPLEQFEGYTSLFGARFSPDGSAQTEFHYGLDMAAPEGSYIRSWWTGQVVEVSDDTACGTSAVIQSGGWEHVYCHMIGYVQEFEGHRYLLDPEGGIQLQEGQEIPLGYPIGRVGMTGRTTGPHLHWGLKYDSQWVDPGLVLEVMYAAQQASHQRG